MLRLLLLYSLITAAPAKLRDDEPKTPTVEDRLVLDVKATPEDGVKVRPDVFYSPQNAYTRVWDPAGDYIALTLNPDSDLNLVAPDDALRAQLKLPKDRGLVATSVREHGAPWEAGVRENDILLSLDDAPLAKPEDLDAKLKQAGEKRLTLELLRKGAPVKLSVQPRVRVSLGPIETEVNTYFIGVGVAPVGPALRAQLDIPERQGLVVTNVSPDSPAAKNDLKVNDVILIVSGQPQQNQGTLAELVQKNGDKPLAVEYLREGVRRTVQITPEKHKMIRLTLTRGREPLLLGSTVVRPGVVQFDDFRNRNLLSNTPGWRVQPEKTAQAAASDAKRLDEMAAEMKELRKAIDGLRKALEDRK